MRHLCFIISFIFVFSACNIKEKKEDIKEEIPSATEAANKTDPLVERIQEHYKDKKIIPFAHSRDKSTYSGTFMVSADIFAEIILTLESGEFRVFINGEESQCDLRFSGYPADLQLAGLSISQEDYNEDGCMDFRLIPNSRDSYGFVYLFDKDKKCFYAAPETDYVTLRKHINNTVGFITFPDPGEKKGLKDKAEILNEDGSLWMSFYIDYFSHDNKWKKNFGPWALESGIGVFVIRCTKVNNDSYTIVVNEDLGIEKYLKKNPNIYFNTIEQHVLKAPILGFNQDENPIREKPDENAPIIKVEDISEPDVDDFFCGTELKGNWVRLKNIFTEKNVGWVKWRQDNLFMIEFYYSI